MNENNSILQTLVSIILFPLLFQGPALLFAWGGEDPLWIALLKRLFLVLPLLAFIAACWITIAALFTVIFRRNRSPFLVSLIVTWWDLLKSFLLFWAGIFRFLFELVLICLGLIRVLLLSLWSLIVDIFFFPFKLIGAGVRGIMDASVPWIALTLTLMWCLVEALIFTYVTTPLVTDVLYVATSRYISEISVQIPLFVLLFFIVLASYAMLQNLFETAQKKKVMAIIGMVFVELFVILVEVMFLYREFVDALVPWFAQYSENFNPGPVVIILVAFGVWFGIRALSWFLFASKGTPFILNIIRAEKIQYGPAAEPRKTEYLSATSGLMTQLKKESRWMEQKGVDFLTAFLLPPLQIAAAVINFIILLFASRHMFELPLKKLSDLQAPHTLVEAVSKEKPAKSRKPAAKGPATKGPASGSNA